jgi:hypothetical protein
LHKEKNKIELPLISEREIRLTSRAAMELPNASDHTLPCRPTISCTADLAAPGTLELEVGQTSSRSSAPVTTIQLPFLLKLTLTPMLQLQFASNGWTFLRGATHTDFFDDLDFGAKVHFVDQSKYGPSIALTALFGTPVANGSHVETFVTLHVSKDIGPLHVDANGGGIEVGLESTPASQAFGALALSVGVTPLVGLALETYIYSDGGPLAPRDGGVRFAATLTPRPWLVFDAGGDVGFYPSTRAFSAFFGMTIIPAILWRKK